LPPLNIARVLDEITLPSFWGIRLEGRSWSEGSGGRNNLG
jgi:hypothetical protein